MHLKTRCLWVICLGLSLSPTRDVTLRFSKFASTSPFPASFWATSQGQKLKRDISKSSEKIKFSNHEIKKIVKFHFICTLNLKRKLDDYAEDGGTEGVRLLYSFYHDLLRIQIIRNANNFTIWAHIGFKSKIGSLQSHLESQRIMVKPTLQSYLSWSAIFSVIIYCHVEEDSWPYSGQKGSSGTPKRFLSVTLRAFVLTHWNSATFSTI